VHAILTPDESLAIVASARRRHRTSLEVVLIWAVASCLTRWQRRNSVAINIVGHGRNTPWPDLNLSRTVGWLNVHYPLVVDLPPDLQPPEAISLVANQLDQVPDYGIGYGVLRYIHNRAPHRQPVELQDEPEAGINYLGDFDTLFNNNKLFRLSKEPTGLGMDPRERSRFRLGIFCYLVDKSINVDWMFSSNLHSRNTIEKLAADVTANMRRSIITHDSANIYYRL
jgi:non-ribosomal peptide synthase protein (TIGR01720 family)